MKLFKRWNARIIGTVEKLLCSNFKNKKEGDLFVKHWNDTQDIKIELVKC